VRENVQTRQPSRSQVKHPDGQSRLPKRVKGKPDERKRKVYRKRNELLTGGGKSGTQLRRTFVRKEVERAAGSQNF